jgi:hypothetical protein
MDIDEVTISRQLAILIQGLTVEERMRFLDEARKSPNMETFTEFYIKNFS